MTGYGEVYYGVHEAAVNYPVAGNVGAGAYRVSIQKKGYSGAATALLIGAHSQVLKQEPEKKQKFFKYSSTALSFQFIEQDVLSLQQFYTEDDREWCLEYTRDSNLIYRGWIFGQNIEEKYFNEQYTFEITATDGLKDLDKIPFADVDGLPFASRLTCLEILVQINRLVGLELPISTVMSVYEASQGQGDTDNVLTVIKPDQQRFLDENGNAKTCKEVLGDLCVLFGANLFQNDGVLCFERWNAEAEGATNRINYDKLGAYVSNTALASSYQISKDTTHAAVWPTVEVNMEPAYKEVVVDYVYKPGSYLFGNFNFDKTVDIGTNTSTETVISATENYKYTEVTGYDFAGYTTFGGATVKKRTLNAEASDALYARLLPHVWEGKTVVGSTPNSPNTQYEFILKSAQNNFAYIAKGSTADSGLRTDKNYVLKNAVINLTLGVSFYIPTNDDLALWTIVIESVGGQKQYLNFANGTKKWQSTYVGNIFIFGGSVYHRIPNLGFCINFLEVLNITVPADGYIYAEFRALNNATDAIIQHFEARVLSAPLFIEAERHAANNLGKYTKVPEPEVLSFSDETMGYLPSTLWKADKLAGSFVKKAGLVFYKLIDLATETIFEQYHRPGMTVQLDYLGQKLNIGQKVTFGATIFPKLGNRTWKVTDNRNYCFETMLGSCNLHEVFSDFVEYDRNNQVLDKDGKTIHIQSDRIETEETAIANSILPWTWDEIPIFDFVSGVSTTTTFSISGITSHYPVIVDWGDGTTQSISTASSFSKNYGTAGNRYINFSFSNPDTIDTLNVSGLIKARLSKFLNLKIFAVTGNFGSLPDLKFNNPLLEQVSLTSCGHLLLNLDKIPALKTLNLHNMADLSSSDINTYLAEVRVKWAGNYAGKIFAATGLTAAPTGQGLTDKAYMQGLGATITTN